MIYQRSDVDLVNGQPIRKKEEIFMDGYLIRGTRSRLCSSFSLFESKRRIHKNGSQQHLELPPPWLWQGLPRVVRTPLTLFPLLPGGNNNNDSNKDQQSTINNQVSGPRFISKHGTRNEPTSKKEQETSGGGTIYSGKNHQNDQNGFVVPTYIPW